MVVWCVGPATGLPRRDQFQANTSCHPLHRDKSPFEPPQDEIGTPWCVTIDFEAIEKDGTFTPRERALMAQK